MKKRKIYVVIMLLLVISLVGCKNNRLEEELDENYPLKIADDSGKEVEIKTRPKRIVSLSKNNTEILFKLGLDEEIVGVTKFCDYPEEALAKEKVRDLESVDIDKIVKLDADLVIEYGSGTSKVRKALEEKGITVLSFAPKTIEETAYTIKMLGEATSSEKGKEISENMLSRYNSIKEERDRNKGVKVFYEEWKNPLLTAGKDTAIDYLIREAGGMNIGEGEGKGYPKFSLEKLEEANIDLYIGKKENNKSIEDIKNMEEYKKIKAIKNNNILLLDGSSLEVPGPRMIDNLEAVYKMMKKVK